jgi:hypothetical protein
MIQQHCYTREWINSFKEQKHLKRINPPILEKMIHALSFLSKSQNSGESSLNSRAVDSPRIASEGFLGVGVVQRIEPWHM